MAKQEDNTVTLPRMPETASADLAARYLKDEDFRAEFDKDPKAAISKAAGREVPSDMEVKIHRNDEKCWHIALPSKARIDALGEEDIDGISGGVDRRTQHWGHGLCFG